MPESTAAWVQVIVVVTGLVVTWVRLDTHVSELRKAMDKMGTMHEENKDKLSKIDTRVEVIASTQIAEKDKLSALEWWLRDGADRRKNPREPQ